MAGKPSFLRDPDQAAELAALLQDTADDLERDFRSGGDGLPRAERSRQTQTIARYRRWADELAPAEAEEPAQPPVQIRPARDVEEATG
jgi:hypothetical protein